MKARNVMEILNISRNTLSTYVKERYIKVEILPTGRYIYDEVIFTQKKLNKIRKELESNEKDKRTSESNNNEDSI